MKKGDKILYCTYQRGFGYSPFLQEATVTKVGRIYFNTSDNHSQIRLSTMQSGDSSDPHKLYFLSEQAHKDYFEKSKLRSKVNKYFATYGWDLTLEQLRKIKEILELH